MPVGFAVNPQVACVSPMMLHHDEDEAIRRGAEGANFFGYSLGHFYVFGEHQPGKTDVWAEYVERRAAQGYDPEAIAAAVQGRDARRQAGSRRHHRPARQRRHARAGARVPASLRGGRRRSGDLRAAGRPQRARAHHGVDRDLRPRGAARVPRARRGAGRRPRRKRLAPAIEAAMARRGRGLPARGHRRLLVPGAARAVGAGHRQRRARGDAAASSPTTAPRAARRQPQGSPADDRSRDDAMLFNPFDPAFRADPYPFYDRLRAAGPVYVTPFGFTVLTPLRRRRPHAAQQRVLAATSSRTRTDRPTRPHRAT